MSKAKLEALLEDLQNAKEGSRELSDRCLRAVGWDPEKDPNHKIREHDD